MAKLPEGVTQEELDRYRKMTPSERLALSLKMTREHTAWLMTQPKEYVDQFFDDLRREKRLSNENILRKLQRSRGIEVVEEYCHEGGNLAS